MSTTPTTQNRKTSARKLAAKSGQTPQAEKTQQKPVVQAKPKQVPVIDVPRVKGQHDLVGAFKKKHSDTIKKYIADNFEAVTEKDLDAVIQECAECEVQKRAPKAGGVWGEATTVIEDILQVVATTTFELSAEDEGLAEAAAQAAVESELSDVDPDIDTSTPTIFTGKGKQTKAAKEKVEAVKEMTPRELRKLHTETIKGYAAEKKKKASEASDLAPEPANKKKASTVSKAVSLDELKKLKGRPQWFSAVEILRKAKEIRIQSQDIEEVMGHLYEVHTGKAKLKEEGFDGNGEKCYRRNRILSFKEKIEALIKKAIK